MIVLLLTSCRTQYVAMPEVHQRDSLSKSVNTRVDSVYEKDSIAIRMVPGYTGRFGSPGYHYDTVYIDHWHTRSHDCIIIQHDTITVTQRDSVPYPVEVPVEVPTPIPRFYKNCTIGFFLLLLAILAYIANRFYHHR